MMRWALAFAAVAVVAGCGANNPNRIPFEGVYYRASADSLDRKDRAGFTVEVRPVSRGLEGARQAAEFRATRYCLQYLGTSDIVWQTAPDAPEEALDIRDDRLTVAGRCVQ